MKICLNIVSMIIILVLAGCGLYETKEDKQGRTIRVNRITGEVAIIEGDKIVRVKNEKEVAEEKKREDALATAKEWEMLSVMNQYPINLKTKWSDGMTSYQIKINGNLRQKSSYYSRITIIFKDNEGFRITSIPIEASRLTGELGFDNKTIEQMEFSEQIPMSINDYRRIATWDVAWAGFNK